MATLAQIAEVKCKEMGSTADHVVSRIAICHDDEQQKQAN